MTEKQLINDKDVWLKVMPQHVQRDNPNIIPTEYFVVYYSLSEPGAATASDKLIKDENGEPKLFESPVAALNFAGNYLKNIL